MELIMRFASWVWGFGQEMLIPAVLALGTLWLCRGRRKKRLEEKGLESTKGHEIALAVFVAFCAGLGALDPVSGWILELVPLPLRRWTGNLF